MQKNIFDFVWNYKKPKVKNKVVIQSIENGGFKVPCIEPHVKASRISWIKRLLQKDCRSMQYLVTFLPNIDFKDFVKCNFNPKDLPTDIPAFYFQILHAWFEMKKEPETPLDVRREYVIFNQYIGIDSKYIYYKSLAENGVLLIDQLVNNTGTFIDFNTFSVKYGPLITQFQYMSLIDAIPKYWRKILKTQTFNTSICSTQEKPFCKIAPKVEKNVYMLKSSEVYWSILSNNKTQATCIKSWADRIDVKVEDKYWEAVFKMPLLCVNEIRI